MTGYVERTADGTAPLRLFCFHHAGGGSSLYRAWQRALGPHTSVWPVLLPGRERRSGEERFGELGPLIADLDAQLDEYLTEPHVFFGHSMGALLAYRLASRRHRRGATPPAALIVSGYSAPHLPSPLPPVEALDDVALIRFLIDLGGLPAPILEFPELLADALPVIRDDLRVCASDRGDGEPPLPCPIHVFGGDADPLVDELGLTAWREHTTAGSEVRILPGDHFSLLDRPDELLDHLRPLLRGYALHRVA
ncbi:thioesterase II family protein [Nocardia lijiangensis]|uniref:thioesterase II family protein n=1 Tax=Nocardia lijiangensis TaxID=299618 RepID=UPI000A0381DB|nr:alpha/beta fold hydrolase [Nocardia lijiangensis]